jgi:C4-dicarboxylate-specific signal transduction histidine kinase
MRIALHSGLAAVAISAYLAGSFSEGQRRARADIARRDRVLFQAERLKTLRAMSVAVIHEISQPLSTLAIESRHLAAISEDPAAHATDIRESARLIERKAETLSNMVRRLRRFGGRAVDEPSLLSLSRVLDETVHLAAGEARAGRSSLRLNVPEEDLLIMGQEVELTQALLNLVRNAIAASPGSAIDISLKLSNSEAAIHISNSVNRDSKGYGGMGIGSLVARAIIEAHGGRLERTASVAHLITHEVTLPLVEVLHG